MNHIRIEPESTDPDARFILLVNGTRSGMYDSEKSGKAAARKYIRHEKIWWSRDGRGIQAEERQSK